MELSETAGEMPPWWHLELRVCTPAQPRPLGEVAGVCWNSHSNYLHCVIPSTSLARRTSLSAQSAIPRSPPSLPHLGL